ncbi:MAG: type II toxin-antitoxin system VapC family toxin [Casimicrobiaceae bacterium]
MTGLDTNVLVRYLTQDDPRQSALANQLIEDKLSQEAPGFISLIALVELVWVLEGAYDCDRAAVVAVLQRLLRAKPLVIERAEAAWQAVGMFAAGKADFADCMIERCGLVNGCDHTLTFDRLAAKDAGMRLLGS